LIGYFPRHKSSAGRKLFHPGFTQKPQQYIGTTTDRVLFLYAQQEFAGALQGLGATTVADLKDMEDEDFATIGMKKLHMNRMIAALQSV
jgi:hypothetical protein